MAQVCDDVPHESIERNLKLELEYTKEVRSQHEQIRKA